MLKPPRLSPPSLHLFLIYIPHPFSFPRSPTSIFSIFLVSFLPDCAIYQVPQGPPPAAMLKKSLIPQPLCPGGPALIITVQLRHTPSRPGHHFPWGGRLSPQVSSLQPAVASSNHKEGVALHSASPAKNIAAVIFTPAPNGTQ